MAHKKAPLNYNRGFFYYVIWVLFIHQLLCLDA
jgi:hypothetical protein